jgi:MinD superfamily P-loop ATPase
MYEIVVLSGKGGTGKTSIAASLAVLAGNEAVIADCDVDTANMHLLLKPDFGNSIEFFSGELAVIKQEQCTRCRKCEDACRFNAIGYLDKKMQVMPIDCEGCGYCEIVCPTRAITMLERKSGNVFISSTKAGSKMAHARLDIGADNSGKLVARVKNEAKSLAVSGNLQYIIIDGAPGIGCPVVSSLAGANYVLLVTEPTMSGLNDLKRICAVIRKFRIKAGCVINKWDLNEEKTSEIKQFLQEAQIEHLADIPYDIRFTKAMTEGKTIVEIQSPFREILNRIWNNIKSQLPN